jgi:hypothetical protein
MIEGDKMLYGKLILLALLFFLSILHADDDNITLLDKYHDDLCQILVDTSNSIDDYFVESNCTEERSSTRAEIINSFAIESRQSFEKDLRIRIRLSLPKIQKNLRLVFEDETNDNTLYDSTRLTNEHLEEKNYYLRLEYFKYVQKKLNMAVAGGVKIRNSNLVPYLNIRSRYSLYDKGKFKSEFYNRFRYYTDSEIDNAFEFNSQYEFDDRLNIFWRNQLSYSNKEEFQTLINDLSWIRTLNKKEQVGAGVGLVSKLKNFKEPNIDYAHVHVLFHHVFYKGWMYYQVAPSILWRESNDFKTSYRYMMNFGLIFDND